MNAWRPKHAEPLGTSDAECTERVASHRSPQMLCVVRRATLDARTKSQVGRGRHAASRRGERVVLVYIFCHLPDLRPPRMRSQLGTHGSGSVYLLPPTHARHPSAHRARVTQCEAAGALFAAAGGRAGRARACRMLSSATEATTQSSDGFHAKSDTLLVWPPWMNSSSGGPSSASSGACRAVYAASLQAPTCCMRRACFHIDEISVPRITGRLGPAADACKRQAARPCLDRSSRACLRRCGGRVRCRSTGCLGRDPRSPSQRMRPDSCPGGGRGTARACSSPMRERSQTMSRRSAPQLASTVSFLGLQPIWNTSSLWCSNVCSALRRLRMSCSATCARARRAGHCQSAFRAWRWVWGRRAGARRVADSAGGPRACPSSQGP